MRQARRLLSLAAWIGLITLIAPSPRAQRASEPVDFAREVNPILQQRCVSCHGGETRRGGLRLDRAADALRGGDSGQVIIPGKAQDSLLIEKIHASSLAERMPPKGDPLSQEQISVLRRWIDEGARWPDVSTEATKARPSHWSFQPINRPRPPEVMDPDWCRNPIDRWVLARLEQSGFSLDR